MSEWVANAIRIGIGMIGLGFFAVQWFRLARDDKARRRRMRRERRDAEIEAKIDRKYRELQREVYGEIRREIQNELRYELRHEIRGEFENLERRLGDRIDAAGRRRIETSGVARLPSPARPSRATDSTGDTAR